MTEEEWLGCENSQAIPVKKPSKEWFVRVHPTHRIETCVVELKEDSEVYLVDPTLWDELAAESTFGARALFLAQNKQAVNFIWPVRLPGPDGRLDDWNRSALEAAQFATTSWCRVQSNRSLGACDMTYWWLRNAVAGDHRGEN